jgi:starch-binding outer membrane protein, SusD/RagB family
MKKNILLINFLFLIYPFMHGQFGTDTVSQSLKRAYTELANNNMYGQNYWAFGDDRTDIAQSGAEFPGEVSNLYEVELHQVNDSNWNVKSFWYRGYTTISFCNYVIENVPSSGLNADEQNRIIAEAKFLRSLMYFNLVNAFDSVPIYREVFYWPIDPTYKDYKNSNRLPNSTNTMAEVYDQIKTDLGEAIGYLPLRSYLNYDNRFRATAGAAKALLSKVYLFESSFAKNYPGDERFAGLEIRWDSALYYAKEVINSGEYHLVGNSGETYDTWWAPSYLYALNTPAFRYIFSVDGNGSDEIVFPAINLTLSNTYTSYGGNGIVKWTTVRYYNRGGSYSFGWGLHVPSQSLIDFFADETGNPKDDPRFIVTVGTAGDSVLTNQSGNPWCAMDFSRGNSYTAACRKYECSPEEYWAINSHWNNSPIDIPVIRFSDVILMASEAALELGQSVNALAYINMVRTRARLSGNTGYPQDLTNITPDDIKNERVLELALEGHRFFDLVRWGLATDILDGRTIATVDGTVNAEFEEGIDEFFPIPAGAIGPYSSVTNTTGINCSLYPNPAKDYLMIQSDLAGAQVMIFDIQGRKVMEATLDGKTTQLDIKKLAEGYYTVQILNQGNLSAMKFIKQ